MVGGAFHHSENVAMPQPVVNARALLVMRNIPVAEIAEKCGVDMPTACRWKRGVSRIPKAARDIIATLRPMPVEERKVLPRKPRPIRPFVEPEGRPITAAYGIRADEIARRCDVNIATARRWKRGTSRIPTTAAMLLTGDLAALDPEWQGWTLR
jgi:transcriptional regulator with XRE-family HTH domain